MELNPWDVGRLTITKDCKILGVALEADSGNELFHQLGQLIDKVGVAVTRIQASLPKPPQDEISKCFMFIKMKNSKVSAKEIEEFLKQQSFVKSVKIIESSKHGIVGDIYHFPTTALNERAIILERNTYSAIIKDVRKLFGTAAEAFIYYIGFEAGKRIYLSLIKLTNGPQLEALIEALKIVSITMGWGIIKKMYVDKMLKKATVTIYENFECDLGRGSAKPYSHFYRGMLAGFFTEYFGEEMTAEETKCIAKGDKYCEFKINKFNPAT